MAKQTEPAEAKRTRAKRAYYVQVLVRDGDMGSGWSDFAGPLTDQAQCRKCLRAEGKPDATYRIVAVLWEGTLKVEKVEKRTLA